MKLPWRKAERRAVEVEDFFGRQLDPSSRPISHDGAAGLSPVFSAVRLISESIASLPCHVTESLPDGTRGTVDHPLDVLFDSPNSMQTRFEFFECVISHQELRGNSYFEVVRQDLRPVALWPLPPGVCRPERRGNRVVFKVNTGKGEVEATADRVCHLKFCTLSNDGLLGADPVKLLREDLGAARNARDHALAFFGNGTSPSGVLTHPGALSLEAADRLRRRFAEAYGGTKNAGGLMTLEEGMEWKAVATDAEKSQLLETRQFTISDVARIWRIPPHFLADLSRSTFSNAASESESFVRNSLRPRVVRLEQALDRCLLSAEERRRGLRIQFVLDALLRGSTLERYRAYSLALGDGWLNRNEVRQLEDRAPGGPELNEFMMKPGATNAGVGEQTNED